jgi:D-alanyl-lipoteichoic acid acyltransferase DltB (MBOAT superfamily)
MAFTRFRPGAYLSAPVPVLFNTLAYARFFSLVFVASWLLVDRRYALVLPLLAFTGYALFVAPSWPVLGVLVCCIAITAWLISRHRRAATPEPWAVATSTVLNLGALGIVTSLQTHHDPLSLAAKAMSIPWPSGTWFGWGTFVAAAALLGALARYARIRLLFLLGASYVFYAHWDYRFLPLIWGSSTLDWLLGKAIGRTEDPQRRKLWLLGTVIVNLGILGFFKYYDFGIDSARTLLSQLGLHVPDATLRIALPVGISFFTFESMSYVIDVYRKHIEPHESYLEYLGFVAFFPHLVAGPIIRPRDLLPQLRDTATFDATRGSQGLYLIATGLLKKVMIGDILAVNLIDRVFDAPLQYSGLENYVAVVAYAVQIYCDFSGYTDIAIGSARLLGIEFPINFNAPYQATNIADFWHRWHISLSTWLRDYLYISLGGNRHGPARTYVNLLLTMLLGGLWHGANWTFVVWGGIHGMALAATRAVERARGKRPALADRHWALRALAVLGTFHVVCVAWVFFRAETFAKAALVFSRIFSGSLYHPNLPPLVIGTLALGLFTHFLPTRWDHALRDGFVRLPAPVQGVCLLLALVLLRQMASTVAVPFVYFQF